MTGTPGHRPLVIRALGSARRALVGLAFMPVRACFRWAGLRDVRGHHVCEPAINEASEVWDLGANRGDFSAQLLARFKCRCLAVEPAPEPFARIPDAPGLEKRSAAIGPRIGAATLLLSANSEASSVMAAIPELYGVVGEITVPVETFASLRAHRGRGPDLVKLDVEGSELEFLRSLSDEELRSVPQWTVEFHDFLPTTGMGPDVRAAKARFRRLGFVDVSGSAYGNLDCLFLQVARCGLTRRQRISLSLLRRVLFPIYRFIVRLSRMPL